MLPQNAEAMETSRREDKVDSIKTMHNIKATTKVANSCSLQSFQLGSGWKYADVFVTIQSMRGNKHSEIICSKRGGKGVSQSQATTARKAANTLHIHHIVLPTAKMGIPRCSLVVAMASDMDWQVMPAISGTR